MNEKTCSHCGDTKPIGEFPLKTGSVDGLNASCRICASQAAMDNYKRRQSSDQHFVGNLPPRPDKVRTYTGGRVLATVRIVGNKTYCV